MTEHTPAPWRIPSPVSGFSAIYGPAGELVFGLAAGSGDERQDDATCEANAALIARAPDLLAENTRLREVNAGLVAALTEHVRLTRATHATDAALRAAEEGA